MDQAVAKADSLCGEVVLPADKSIAHRAALFAALGDGLSVVSGFPSSADPRSTLSCLRQLGVEMREEEPGCVTIVGKGLYGLQPPTAPLDCGNSGTTMRLLAGILAGQRFPSTLMGDASLTRRPMGRIATPLGLMRATLTLSDGHAPVAIAPSDGLAGIQYALPVASAQVKSCVLLAGLYADSTTTVVEQHASRDHTERMLGLPVEDHAGTRRIHIEPGHHIPAVNRGIPLDFSAAAFFLVGGSVAPDSTITMFGVGLNPTRCALLEVLGAMGADIMISRRRVQAGEPVGDLTVRSAQLRGVSIGGAVIPNLIDEIPVLAIAAACAEGRTEVRGAAELRVKETDRIHAITTNLRALGAVVEEFEDGFAVTGPQPLTGTVVESYGDHRIGMAMGIAGLVAAGATTVRDAAATAVSYPTFWQDLERLAS